MIVCLGWGSLIDKPDGLPLAGTWSADGPVLPVEFARESSDGRITLVVAEHDAPVPVLWAPLEIIDMDCAQEALRMREKATYLGSIGRWPIAHNVLPHAETIGKWMQRKGFEGVVWTALKPGMREDRERRVFETPTLERVKLHLEGLEPEARARAANYVITAPKQIVTPYRQDLEDLLR